MEDLNKKIFEHFEGKKEIDNSPLSTEDISQYIKNRYLLGPVRIQPTDPGINDYFGPDESPMLLKEPSKEINQMEYISVKLNAEEIEKGRKACTDRRPGKKKEGVEVTKQGSSSKLFEEGEVNSTITYQKRVCSGRSSALLQDKEVDINTTKVEYMVEFPPEEGEPFCSMNPEVEGALVSKVQQVLTLKRPRVLYEEDVSQDRRLGVVKKLKEGGDDFVENNMLMEVTMAEEAGLPTPPSPK